MTAPYRAVSPPLGVRVRSGLRHAWALAREPNVPPDPNDARARFLYGLHQPLLGVRMLLHDRALRRDALLPVVVVVVICAAVAAFERLPRGPDLPWWALDSGGLARTVRFVATFTATFIALAPVPPFLFARHYARMAARARNQLGLGPRTPYLKPITQSIGETIAQTVVIAIGLAPVALALALFGGWGAVIAFIAQSAWTVHWMVVEALDNGRSLAPHETVAELTRQEQALRHQPWFVRGLEAVKHRTARRLLAPVRGFASIIENLTRGWGPELRLIERDRALAMGFGLGVVLLLAVPGVNLCFRPALVIAAAHLRGQLELQDELD